MTYCSKYFGAVRVLLLLLGMMGSALGGELAVVVSLVVCEAILCCGSMRFGVLVCEVICGSSGGTEAVCGILMNVSALFLRCCLLRRYSRPSSVIIWYDRILTSFCTCAFCHTLLSCFCLNRTVSPSQRGGSGLTFLS